MYLSIRPEVPADIPAIHTLTVAAFLNAPHTDHNEQFIIDALRAAWALSISLVAEEGDTVVGHVAVSPVSISDGADNWIGLGPISVSPERQGQGIGSCLMCKTLKLLEERGAAGCVVLGDPTYYQRFDFKPESALILPDVPPEYFLAVSYGQSLARGRITYHDAFAHDANYRFESDIYCHE